ncbi:MAG: hypothetical protein AB7D27_17425 [Desulfomicrobium sp.]
MDNSIIAAIIGAAATIFAVFIGWLLQKSSKEIPQIIQTKTDNKPSRTETGARRFAQRYLDYPSHYRSGPGNLYKPLGGNSASPDPFKRK